MDKIAPTFHPELIRIAKAIARGAGEDPETLVSYTPPRLTRTVRGSLTDFATAPIWQMYLSEATSVFEDIKRHLKNYPASRYYNDLIANSEIVESNDATAT